MELKFDVVPSDYEEIFENYDFSYEKVEELACNKAMAVLAKIGEPSLIIGADTVVVLSNKILGKPKDKADAINMLKQLSGEKHSVVTSICVIDSKNLEKKVISTTSYVEFEVLNDDLIKNYVDNYRPLDKAGAYGIQELPDGFVKNIEGSFENIVGLCSLALMTILKEFK